MKNRIIKHASLNALAAAAYIALVALIMSNIERLIGPREGDGGVLSIIAFLILFVISAAAMGLAIFGRPIMWYLSGQKTEAVKLVFYTLGFLVVIALIIFLILIS